jgi:hypothetical protein
MCLSSTVNLVCNAAQAVHHGFIEVVFEQVGEHHCAIRVSDTGPGATHTPVYRVYIAMASYVCDWLSCVVCTAGVDASQIPLLFEKYKQLGPGRSSGGSGLGLVLAQQIAAAFGTRITVRSPWQESGQAGTSMEILLRDCVVMPVNVGAEIAIICVETARDDFEAVRDLKGILVVEDEQLNRMVSGE